MTVKVLISSNADNLESALREEELAGKGTVTVEAEYGDRVVRGSCGTMAHHGPRGGVGSKCPCLYVAGDLGLVRPDYGETVVGISHIDLDTIGGLWAVFEAAGAFPHPKPDKPSAWPFWRAAAFVDLNGPHRADRTKETYLQLAAYWAFGRENRVYPPRDGGVKDVTVDVVEHLHALHEILTPGADRHDERMRAGANLIDAEAELETKSFRSAFRQKGGAPIVLFRESDRFVNHLYRHGDEVAAAVVGYNTDTGEVTVSFEAGDKSPISARRFVQLLYGPEAGGHHGIAGSPRGGVIARDTLASVQHLLGDILSVTATGKCICGRCLS